MEWPTLGWASYIMYDHMLIDARNAIYRAIYAGLTDSSFTNNSMDHVVILFRFIASYVQRFKPKQVHFFWDAPKDTLWRKSIDKDYKEGRDVTHNGKYADVDIDGLLRRSTEICMDLVPCINSRNYKLDKQEADDLIYAFCKQNTASKILIVSSDGDFKQIPFHMKWVDLFNPMRGESLVDIPEDDPVEIKSLTGEKGDNIIGYPRIGPKTAHKIVHDVSRRKKLFNDMGKVTYMRNKILVDLSLCPKLARNILYVLETMLKDTEYNNSMIMNIIQKYKVKGLSGEIKRTILPFKFLNK